MGFKKFVSARTVLAVGAATMALLVVACAPQPAGTPGPTTTTSSTIPWSTPTGTWSFFNMSCSVDVLGTYYPFAQSASINVEAPASVSTGQTFNMMIAPGAFIVPTNVQGFDLTSLSWMTIRFPLSPNLQFVDSVMSAGINMGSGYPGVAVEGSDLVYRVPGPFTPGAEVQMPKVRVTVKAIGAPGSSAQVKMTSMVSTVTVSLIDVVNYCTPDGTQTYGTINITN